MVIIYKFYSNYGIMTHQLKETTCLQVLLKQVSANICTKHDNKFTL